MTNNNLQYDAFICYIDYDFDRRAAQTLRDRIVSYKPPRKGFEKSIRERFDQVYLETVEEVRQAGLSDTTRRLLDQSAFLIVVCSPRAKDSSRFKEIIEYFKATGKEEHILPLLIEGEPKNAFPPALFGDRTISLTNNKGETEEINVEPLATDIRSGSISKSLARIRPMRLKIIAAMIGCSYDDLEQRHLRRIQRRVAVTTAVVTVVAFGFIFIFTYMWQDALRQEMIAKKQTTMATDLLNSMFHELPEKFKNIPEAKPVIKGLLLDNIQTLGKSGSQSVKVSNIKEVLRDKPDDSAGTILWKARLLREFGWKKEALHEFETARHAPDVDHPDEYFEIARLFTQAGFIQGEYVKTVRKGLPAALSGIRAGDVIIEFKGIKVGGDNDLYNVIGHEWNFIDLTFTYLRFTKTGTYVKRSFKTSIEEDDMLGIDYEPI